MNFDRKTVKKSILEKLSRYSTASEMELFKATLFNDDYDEKSSTQKYHSGKKSHMGLEDGELTDDETEISEKCTDEDEIKACENCAKDETEAVEKYAEEETIEKYAEEEAKDREKYVEGKGPFAHLLCKFLRKGFCREGANCRYSHDAKDSRRCPELCKFYQKGYCRQGAACKFLHGEYPCVDYHTTKCIDDECRYSHEPLNDFTRPMIDHIGKVMKIGPMPSCVKRKPLLATPPKSLRHPIEEPVVRSYRSTSYHETQRTHPYARSTKPAEKLYFANSYTSSRKNMVETTIEDMLAKIS